MLGLGPDHKILVLALPLEVSALNAAALALWVKSLLWPWLMLQNYTTLTATVNY